IAAPGKALNTVEGLRQGSLFSASANDGDDAGVIAASGMIEKSDFAAIRRYAKMTEPAARVVTKRADRKFETHIAGDGSNDCQLIARRIPIRVLDVAGDFPRRTAGE